MRIKTMNSIVEEIKQIDGFSAINLGMLRMLFETKALKSIQRGNRTVSDMDQLIEELNQLWGIEEKYKVPRIRSIHNAFLELREIQPQLGLSEERIRFLVSQKSYRVSKSVIGHMLPLNALNPRMIKTLCTMIIKIARQR